MAFGYLKKRSPTRYGKRSITLITAPTTELVTTAEAKVFLKVTSSVEDSLIDLLVSSARRSAEEYTRRAFITQSWKLTLDGFGYIEDVPRNEYEAYFGTRSNINLPRPPLQSVTSITTYDRENNDTVFASSNYTVDTAGARIFLNSGAAWPINLRDNASMEILFVAGYGNAATDVPEPIKQAVLMHISRMYDHRGVCEMPKTTKQLLNDFRKLDELGITV